MKAFDVLIILFLFFSIFSFLRLPMNEIGITNVYLHKIQRLTDGDIGILELILLNERGSEFFCNLTVNIEEREEIFERLIEPGVSRINISTKIPFGETEVIVGVEC